MVTITTEQEDALFNHLREQNIIFTTLGQTVAGNISIDGQDFEAYL